MAKCLVCGVNSKEEPLIAYPNEDFSLFLYLCHTCHDKIVARTKGVIPFNKILDEFAELGGDEFGGEKSDDWSYPEKFPYLSRELSCIFGL